MSMNPWDILVQLYQSEINAGVQSDWDGGIVAWIGGPAITSLGALPKSESELPLSAVMHPVLSIRVFGSAEFENVADWLDTEARRLFPNSAYAHS